MDKLDSFLHELTNSWLNLVLIEGLFFHAYSAYYYFFLKFGALVAGWVDNFLENCYGDRVTFT